MTIGHHSTLIYAYYNVLKRKKVIFIIHKWTYSSICVISIFDNRNKILQWMNIIGLCNIQCMLYIVVFQYNLPGAYCPTINNRAIFYYINYVEIYIFIFFLLINRCWKLSFFFLINGQSPLNFTKHRFI